MDDLAKLQILKKLLDVGSGTVDVGALVVNTGSARRARRAIFVARKNGVILEPVRNQGRGVDKYQLQPNGAKLEDVIAAKLQKPKRAKKTADQTATPAE